MTKFGAWMKYYRNRLGMTQKDLAQRVGVSEFAISTYENNRRTPSFKVLDKLAFALDVPIQELASKMEDKV